MSAQPDMTPGSPDWARIVTASKVAAILGISPWESQRSMYHLMRGDLPPAVETRPMRRGNKLEDAILDWWRDDQTDNVSDVGRQVLYRLDGEDWCAATPDMVVVRGDGDEELVDAKTAATNDGWGTPGTDQVPAHYVASSMWQLAMAPHIPRVRLAVLFGRPFDLVEYVIERDDEVIGRMIDLCREFYDSVQAGTPPPLDDSVATYDAMKALHPDIDRDAEVDVTEAERDDYLHSWECQAAAKARFRASSSSLLERMGRARIAKCNGAVVARRQPNKYGVSLVAVAKPTALEEAETA